MTIEEVRDDVALRLGWDRFESGPYVKTGGWEKHPDGKPVEVCFDPTHPVPDTIDGVAKLMPEGWRLALEQRQTGEWWAEAFRDVPDDYCPTQRGPTEYEARLRLLHAVLLAQGAKP